MPISDINITTYPIRLGQFLKLIDYVQDGMEAKLLIQEGNVKVNGVIDTRRGRQLQENDVVELDDGTSYLLR